MKVLRTGILLGGLAILAVPAAEALPITPTSGVLNVSRWEDLLPTTNSTPAILIEAQSLCACDLSTQLFNQDLDGDPSGVNIDFDGGRYLLVKDGYHFPSWYLFDLAALGWNGTDQLQLSGFWPGPGAISHVSIYGPTTSVPEPATLVLLGAGLLGLGMARRRRTAPRV